MKKTTLKFVILLFLCLFLLTGCSNNNNSSNNIDNSASRISTDLNMDEAENRLASLDANHTGGNLTISGISGSELSSYSTTIKDNASGRLTNIRLTCDIINGTIVNPGDTFSFNDVVGKPTAQRGYQEASVIINHETEKGIGGGNCQVSSTLYNAVLNIPSLVVTERHEHGKDVTYVPEGKDAAVSYGSLDFKFRNDTGNKIRIDLTTDDKSIVAKLVQIPE